MGTKFGNLQVKCDDPGRVEWAIRKAERQGQALQDYQKRQAVYEFLKGRGIDEYPKPRSIYEYLSDPVNGWITVLGDLGCGPTTEDSADNLSRQLSAPVLSVSVFDDDVLWMALYENGERLVRYAQFSSGGNKSEDYGRKPKTDYKLFAEKLGISEAALKEALCPPVDEDGFYWLKDIVDAFSALLGPCCWMKADWLEDGRDADSGQSYHKIGG